MLASSSSCASKFQTAKGVCSFVSIENSIADKMLKAIRLDGVRIFTCNVCAEADRPHNGSEQFLCTIKILLAFATQAIDQKRVEFWGSRRSELKFSLHHAYGTMLVYCGFG